MDPPSGQSQAPGAPTPGHRDMMFCHECHDEWYRDERGLTCPECGSDFTEIIEDDNDPRDPDPDPDPNDGDDDSMRDVDTAAPPLHPLHELNPWRNDDDPEEGDISNLQWRQVGPGRFAVSMNRTISPQILGGTGGATSAIGGFATLLNQIIGGGGLVQQANQGNQDNQEGGRGTPGATTGSGTLPGGHRFTYSSTARLIPRDTDRPSNVYPQDEMNNLLAGLMATMGEAGGHQHRHDDDGNHNHDDHHNHNHNHNHDDGFPLSPFMSLFARMMPGNGQAGDFVYSQEALDRIVSQLMEQTATSSAPGPASQADIDALPRKHVSADMLGSEGKAECSICMDEVNIGEEVTELPCRHWFHHQCVAAWLSEHDTCPHCRQGIGKFRSNDEAQGSGGASGHDASRQMPGAFGGSGEGTFADPYVVHESASPNAQGRAEPSSRPGSGEDAGAGGFSDRLRRGLFGPPR